MSAERTWPRSLKNLQEVEQELANDTKIKIAGIDLTGILRGKVISKEKFLSCVKNNSLGFCSVIFGWDMQDKLYLEESKYSNEQNGYGDIQARIDLASFRRIPWEKDMPFFLLDFFLDESKILPICPRNVLKEVIGRLNDQGYEPYCGVEFEWFNYKETPDSLAQKEKPTPLTPGMFGYSLLRTSLNQAYFDDIYDECKKFGVHIEGIHTETGPGVYEAALAYSPALKMADNAVLFKTSVKQIALRHNVIASFMAKPSSSLPGCSGHIHFSLSNVDSKENAFSDSTSVSESLNQFVAGIVQAFPSIMPILAPTINSYKRLVENFWAPVKVSWGIENRLAAIRVIAPPTCSPSATRVEVRVPGADINPCLAISAILAAGHYGIANKLENPLPALQYGDSLNNYPGAKLPKSLKEAVEIMDKPDSLARKILGKDFVDHYVLASRHEVRLWENAVTDWELKRYFELV